MFSEGRYPPPTLEETVEICAALMDIFDRADIKIIKLGLHADTGLEGKIVAGPYHPALRELWLARQKLLKIKQRLTNVKAKSITIKVNPKQLSQWKGQKNSNITALAQLGFEAQIVADSTVKEGECTISENFKGQN